MFKFVSRSEGPAEKGIVFDKVWEKFSAIEVQASCQSRDRELARVTRAWKVFRGRPDRKERTARRAGVSKNFVAYAIRRKEVPNK
jgi:hypothetical protein